MPFLTINAVKLFAHPRLRAPTLGRAMGVATVAAHDAAVKDDIPNRVPNRQVAIFINVVLNDVDNEDVDIVEERDHAKVTVKVPLSALQRQPDNELVRVATAVACRGLCAIANRYSLPHPHTTQLLQRVS